jgi:superfamily II DNA or RNA helicase
MASTDKISPGSIIELRSRLWRVDDLKDDVLTATTIEGTPLVKRKFFLPLENARPSTITPPDPEKVGNYQGQDLLTRAYRLSMIHGTAPFLGLQRSRVIPEPFQMVPLIMALDMPRVRLLIADDVGLGKTIEGGLIIAELFARNRASRLLVICPASLRMQWKESLAYFFHIDAQIISSQTLRQLERSIPPGVSPWEYYPYLIVSMDYAKSPQNRASVLEQPLDIVLIDEVHNLAKPHQVSGSHTIKKDLWDLGREISKKTKHLILLTATPHNGYTDSFASLLFMLNVNAVRGEFYRPTINRDIAKSFVCQRRRIDVEQEFGIGADESPFPKRQQDETYVDLSPEEKKVNEMVETLGKNIIDSSLHESAYHQRISRWTVIHLHKRAISSPRALRISLKNRLDKVNKKLDAIAKNDEDLVEDYSFTEEEVQADVFDNDSGERISEEDVGTRLEQVVPEDEAFLRSQKAILKTTLKEAESITPAKDSKLKELRDNVLRSMIRRDNKVIIFTKYKDTLEYLASEIQHHRNYEKIPIYSVYGEGLPEELRREKLKEFAREQKGILIATDCISEGIDLQYMAAQIIHYELPWNPNRLEQRNGRVDRYGQIRRPGGEHKVYISTLVLNEPLEAGICKVLVEKSRQIRQDHGFSPPFFGDDLSILDLIREHGLDIKIGQVTLDKFIDTPERREIIDPLSDAVIQKMKDETFYGQSAIDISEIKAKMKETEIIIGSSREIQHFVGSCLNRFSSSMTLNQQDQTYRIEIRDPKLQRYLAGKDLIPRATFDPLRSKNDKDLEVIDIGHPLVQSLIDMGKELTFTSDEIYGRTSAVQTPDVPVVSAVYTFLARYTIQTDPISIVEELLTTGINLYSGGILPDDQMKKSLAAKPVRLTRTMDEVKEDLRLALNRPDLQSIIQKKTEERCGILRSERKKIKEKLMRGGSPDWLEGFDKVSLSSTDLLCATVYYPDIKGGS